MVSLIVPVYNIKEYLPACVQSLVAQTYTQLQILLVDDGATDGSGALCDRFTDARIQVIHKENGGLSSARNAGLDAATGDWVMFVDGDDYLAPDAVERLLAAATPGTDMVQFAYREVPDDSWQPDTQVTDTREETHVAEFFRQLYALGGIGASACTKLFSRTLFASLRFQEGILHEDEELMTRLLPLCHRVVYTQLVLYGYRMRPGSIVHSRFKPGRLDVFPIMEKRLAVLENLGLSDLADITRQRLFVNGCILYCAAKKDGFPKEADALRQQLRALSEKDIPGLPSQYRLLHRCTRITAAAPEIYYHLRKLFGKG
ncbi:MAG: glycosyltransferase [Oscillospiraceae bacterium]|nr:glycosyltransferase [Oscillospiraceae bacterium]